MVHKVIYCLFLLTLTGCHSFSLMDIPHFETAPWLKKGTVLYENKEENTPVIFNGQQLDIVWKHDVIHSEFGLSFDIHDGETQTLLSNVHFPYGFICALVSNGTLYVFGSSQEPMGTQNVIAMTSSTDLQTWTTPVTVLTAPPGATFYNTSVAPDATGFIMAAEFCVYAPDCYDFHFYHSTDLTNWTHVGGSVASGIYTACPMIRFSNGYYYVTYLRNFDQIYMVTFIARSKDLTTWEFSPQAVIAPDDDGSDGMNTSDMDMVELPDGRVKVIFANGYQVTGDGHYVNDRVAYYEGTQDEFFAEFFKGDL